MFMFHFCISFEIADLNGRAMCDNCAMCFKETVRELRIVKRGARKQSD